MGIKQILIITATVTGLVLAWSAVMAWLGQAVAVATLAPVLGLTIVQIVRAVRVHAPAAGPREAAVSDEEDDAAR
ncbi:MULTISPECIES: hypothetical protein [unclassified Streptomyces]|uniref:hypothetical protein n=1 Tax=unclassified Streptomyces TaxID=2593676 RepID=UPI0004C4E272|nr:MULTISPECIES: hypothetical protein [unclassified Streptomyces]KOV92163.1 hypothetical protein ADL02_12055 [Streptomyces sp. NRRL WC-3723]